MPNINKSDPFKVMTRGFVAWLAFCAIVGLGFLGVIVWAIIEIVGKVTS